MLQLDLISTLIGAGPIGAAYLLQYWDKREMRQENRDATTKLVALIEEKARTEQALAVAISAQNEIQKYRVAADEKLAHQIELLRIALEHSPSSQAA